MDKRKRHLILIYLKSKKIEGDSDLVEVISSLIQNPMRILDVDDFFNFNDDICLTKCDENCCIGTSLVRISPIDVDYMMQSPFLKGKTREQVINNYLVVFAGRDISCYRNVLQLERAKEYKLATL